MKIEVLGSGCANCRNTVALIEQVAQSAGIRICSLLALGGLWWMGQVPTA